MKPGMAVLLLVLSIFRSRPAEAADLVAWTRPERARIIRSDRPSIAPREVNPGRPVELEPADLLLVPIGPGDRLRIRGATTAVGLGTGPVDQPDVVTWLPDVPGEEATRRVDVPAWSASRVLVVRNRSGQRRSIRVEIAANVADALAWHRFDQRVYDWLRGRPVDMTRAARGAPSLSLARKRTARARRRTDPARAAWLMTRWLEEVVP